MSAEDLRKLASEREISGRSEMNKDELVRALQSSEAASTEVTSGELLALRQTIEGLQNELSALSARVTAIELSRSGQMQVNPNPQRR